MTQPRPVALRVAPVCDGLSTVEVADLLCRGATLPTTEIADRARRLKQAREQVRLWTSEHFSFTPRRARKGER